MNTPEAQSFKKEQAGAYAKYIDRHIRAAKRLNSGSKVLIPSGTHGGMVEFILAEALVRKDADGKEIIGIDNIAEVGGDIDPSEAFDVVIKSDEKGELKPLKVKFDNPNRPQGEMYLDMSRIEELKNFYDQMHQEELE